MKLCIYLEQTSIIISVLLLLQLFPVDLMKDLKVILFHYFSFLSLRKILFHSNNYFSMYIDLFYLVFFLNKNKKTNQLTSNILLCFFFIISKSLHITFAFLCYKEGTCSKLLFLLFLWVVLQYLISYFWFHYFVIIIHSISLSFLF